MPFGTRPLGARSHDFDAVWERILRPGAPPDWETVRIDEIHEPGPIPEQFKHFLRVADVVVFDLTSANPNVLYELGLRDVFAPGRRVLVLQEGSALPFNLQSDRVLFYPIDIEGQDGAAFVVRLRESILAADCWTAGTLRSPPPEAKLIAQLDRATTLPALVAIWEDWKAYSNLSTDILLRLARRFADERRSDLALAVAERAYAGSPDDWEVARIYGWYLRRADRLDEAQKYLEQAVALNPRDVEGLGMLGGILKRRARALLNDGKREDALRRFESARDCYVHALDVDPRNTYHLVNAGACALIAGETDNRWYGEVVDLHGGDTRSATTWDLLALGEAQLGRNDEQGALSTYTAATERKDYSVEMRDSASEQLMLLREFGAPAALIARALGILSGEKIRPGGDIVILHLSDLHFGTKPTTGGNSVPMHRFRQKSELHSSKTLAAGIAETAKGALHAGDWLVVVVSGDIGYQATQEEYNEASKFLTALVNALELPAGRVILAPGNHDVNWAVSSANRSNRFDNWLCFLQASYGEDLKTFYPFLNFDFRMNSERPTPDRIVGVHRYAERGMIAVAMNSCVVEDDRQHFGAIGEDQLAHVEGALEGVDPAWLRVAVLHHHVLPLETNRQESAAAYDGTIVHDFGVIETRLHKLGFDLVLHGHKHEPGIRLSSLVSALPGGTPKPLIVCGAGSAGVDVSELPPRGNHFAMYRVRSGPRRANAAFLDADWRRYPLGDTTVGWQEAGRWTISG